MGTAAKSWREEYAPETDNHPLSTPYPFNLMFQTSIGPSGSSTGFFRPKTAQGIFVNFMDIYFDNGYKLPFAIAQVGQAFGNKVDSHRKTVAATAAGRFKDEIIPVATKVVDPKSGDDGIRNTTLSDLAKLKPLFKKDGTTTAVQWTDCNLAGTLDLLRVLIYKGALQNGNGFHGVTPTRANKEYGGRNMSLNHIENASELENKRSDGVNLSEANCRSETF